MKKAVWSAAATAAFLACASTAQAQSQLATASIQATVNVGNQARLTVSGDISFPDSDPDFVASIPASAAVSINARARVQPNQGLVVTVEADDTHIDEATDTIPVTNLTWTATGTNFVNGTMSDSPVNVASWTGAAQQTGTQNYALVNSWDYAPGTHTVVLTYTLTTP